MYVINTLPQLLVDILNGSDWPAFYKYLLAAFRYTSDFIFSE